MNSKCARQRLTLICVSHCKRGLLQHFARLSSRTPWVSTQCVLHNTVTTPCKGWASSGQKLCMVFRALGGSSRSQRSIEEVHIRCHITHVVALLTWEHKLTLSHSPYFRQEVGCVCVEFMMTTNVVFSDACKELKGKPTGCCNCVLH